MPEPVLSKTIVESVLSAIPDKGGLDIDKAIREGVDLALAQRPDLKSLYDKNPGIKDQLVPEVKKMLREVGVTSATIDKVFADGKITDPEALTMMGQIGNKQFSTITPDPALKTEVESIAKKHGVTDTATLTGLAKFETGAQMAIEKILDIYMEPFKLSPSERHNILPKSQIASVEDPAMQPVMAP